MLRRIRVAADVWREVLDHFYYVSSDEEWEHSFDANSLFGVLLIIMYYVLTIMSLNLHALVSTFSLCMY